MKIKYFFGFLLLINSLAQATNRYVHQARMAQDRANGPIKKKKPISTSPTIIPPKKIKRKGLQGYKHVVSFSQMNYPQLMTAKEENKKAKNWDVVIKYLTRMITMCETEGVDYLKEKANLIIELADILFEQQRYDDAVKWYTEFNHAHVGDSRFEYASYKAIVCASHKILSSDRDQTATEKTLELADAFLKQENIFTRYKKEVQKIQHHCYQVLAQSDCNIAEFYLTYGNYHAAEQRLKGIRTHWLDKAPEINIQLAQLEVALSAVQPQFTVPASSIKLAELKSPVKKADMTTRF